MKLSDTIKNTVAAAAVGAVTVGAVAIGTLFNRQPQAAQRAARTLMGGAQRVGEALEQTARELGELWNEMREPPPGSGRADAAAVEPDEGLDASPPPAAPRKRGRAGAAKGSAAEPTSTGSNGSDRRRSSRSRPH